jgi:hypothetical protein
VFLSSAVPAEGTIVTYAESRSSEGDLSYYPVVAFTPKDGPKLEFQSRAGGSLRGAVEERVEVLYDPRNPHWPEICSFRALGFALLLALGLGFAVIGAALFVAFPTGSSRSGMTRPTTRSTSSRASRSGSTRGTTFHRLNPNRRDGGLRGLSRIDRIERTADVRRGSVPAGM